MRPGGPIRILNCHNRKAVLRTKFLRKVRPKSCTVALAPPLALGRAELAGTSQKILRAAKAEGKETANRWASWMGPVSRIAASFGPRGVNAKLGCNLSKNTASCQTGIVSQRTNANEAVRMVSLIRTGFVLSDPRDQATTANACRTPSLSYSESWAKAGPPVYNPIKRCSRAPLASASSTAAVALTILPLASHA